MKRTAGRLLSIETTHEWLGLSLSEGTGRGRPAVRAWFLRKAGTAHSERIIPGLDRLLRKARWRPRSLGAVAVDAGPGSFTGARIGVTVARTLAHELGIPLIAIPSLDIMAAGARNLEPGARIAAVSRAVPGEVYAALYRVRRTDERLARRRGASVESWPWLPARGGLVIERLLRPAWMGWEAARERFRKAGGKVRMIGRSWDDASGVEAPGPLDPRVLAALGHWAWARGAGRKYREVTPLYLQPSWAERRR